MKVTIEYRFNQLHISTTTDEGLQTKITMDVNRSNLTFDHSLLNLIHEKHEVEFKEIYG